MRQSTLFVVVLGLACLEYNLATPFYGGREEINVARFDRETAENSKSIAFGQRLASIDDALLQSALERLEARLAQGVTNEDEILANASPQDRKTLLVSMRNLYKNHPEAKGELDGFFNSQEEASFAEADAKFSVFDEWNTYWETFFKVYADYMEKYG